MSNPASGRALIVFIKDPDSGQAKTRIANVAGAERAREIYRKLLEITRTTTSEVEAKRFLFYADAVNPTDEWPTNQYHKKVQTGATLGSRMKAAFAEVLTESSRVIIIGSDCPYLTPDALDAAFAALEKFDVVIGPTFDGGYYLLGMKVLHHTLFEGIDWSSNRVYTQTVEAIESAELSRYELPVLHDVDYIEDWETYLRSRD